MCTVTISEIRHVHLDCMKSQPAVLLSVSQCSQQGDATQLTRTTTTAKTAKEGKERGSGRRGKEERQHAALSGTQ